MKYMNKMGLIKIGALPFNKLKAVLNKETPLFHMVNKNNVRGFLDSKSTLLTPLESASKGRLKNVEGGTWYYTGST
jgi:flagellar biosynthesis/type III secretory pathway chaperone